MPYAQEREIFEAHIRKKNLKHTEQRTQILVTFLETERHLTVEELYVLVRKKYPSIGYATISRTVKLLCDCGLCSELKVEDGVTRYEHLYGHDHHDHLICVDCGRFVEVVSPEIERLQEELAAENDFTIERHRLGLYGKCKKCRP
ncbi:MAG: transcriptional repressor [Desulfobacterales bacterium]